MEGRIYNIFDSDWYIDDKMKEDWLNQECELYNDNEYFTTLDKDRAYQEYLDDVFHDAYHNLCKQVNGVIVVYADLGLWNGRVQHVGVVGHNISDCISGIKTDGYMHIYCSTIDGLHITLNHHDGTNYFLFRVCESDEAVIELKNKFIQLPQNYSPEQKESWFKKYTKSLYPDLVEIFEWEGVSVEQ